MNEQISTFIYTLQITLCAVLADLGEASDPLKRRTLAFEAQNYRRQLREFAA